MIKTIGWAMLWLIFRIIMATVSLILLILELIGRLGVRIKNWVLGDHQ